MLDRGLSTLHEDLADRGLLDKTSPVTMGNFGRTPRINGNAGIDHWGTCSSVALAGGPVRRGTIVGSSDSIGAYLDSRQRSPPDLLATTLQAAGVNSHQLMHGRPGSPIPLSTGDVIAEAVA